MGCTIAATRSRKSCANPAVGPGRGLMKIYGGVSSIERLAKVALEGWVLRCGNLVVGDGR